MNLNVLVHIAGIIVPVALPLLVIWLVMRAKINKDNAQKEIMMTALEKNPQISIESLARTLDAGGKSIKEKLINKFTWGCVLSAVGIITIIILSIALDGISELQHANDAVVLMFIAAGFIMAVGIGLIANYIAGRKLLSKEMEADEQQKSKE